MDKMTIIEAADYIAKMDFDGVTLTPSGANAAKAILSRRVDWTPSHFLMLNRLESGAMKVPLKLSRLVSRTRLGDALDLVRDLNRKHIKNQKCKARRKAAMARMAAHTRKGKKTMKKATKTELNALYTAFDIHRRAAILAALWTAFDPFGAVVYQLCDLENAAFGLREAVNDAKEYWNYDEEPYHPLRPIKEGKDKYKTFRKHIKGIKGALLRLLRNKWIAKEVDIEDKFRLVKESLAELESNI